MKQLFLGIDTSNYTTSLSLCNQDGEVIYNNKELLQVKEGQVGLRQSDAVFEHIKNLQHLTQSIIPEGYSVSDITAVGVSTAPTTKSGSYMPCFMVGMSLAQVLSSLLNVPLYHFSHQQGHVVAALYGSNSLKLLHNRFLAFHVSGGTTDLLMVNREKQQLEINEIGSSLDLKAGQAIDRVGHYLDLPFPAGPYLDKLASNSDRVFKCKPTIKGLNCCLSGLENQCQKMIASDYSKEDVAKYCICYIQATLEKMTSLAIEKYGQMPVLFAGGVMSNSIISKNLKEKFNGIFAPPVFSSDNAAGISVLTYLEFNKWQPLE